MKTHKFWTILLSGYMTWTVGWAGEIIDWSAASLNPISLESLQLAKEHIHAAYGTTSHGTQLYSGNGAGSSGLNALYGYNGVYQHHREGKEGTLHLYIGGGYGNGTITDLVGDAGWKANQGSGLRFVEETRLFLGTPNPKGRGSAHPEINVIMWAWCGQVASSSNTAFDHYFSGMDSLEKEYPEVIFVYMTGHLNGTGPQGLLHQRNERIRQHAQDHNKWLYDFADIERYDPDGTDYLDQGGDDGAAYDADGDGSTDSNWAIQWTAQHSEQVNSKISAAHTEPLVGQMKTLAMWRLFARIAATQQQTTQLNPLKQPTVKKQPRSTSSFDALGRSQPSPKFPSILSFSSHSEEHAQSF